MERIERLIFEQAERSPDADAVEHRGARLSYAELLRQSMRVSRALAKFGLKPGQTVGFYQERSLSTLPLLLGAWDAGAVVVPINPNVPAKMLAWIIQRDFQAKRSRRELAGRFQQLIGSYDLIVARGGERDLGRQHL